MTLDHLSRALWVAQILMLAVASIVAAWLAGDHLAIRLACTILIGFLASVAVLDVVRDRPTATGTNPGHPSINQEPTMDHPDDRPGFYHARTVTATHDPGVLVWAAVAEPDGYPLRPLRRPAARVVPVTPNPEESMTTMTRPELRTADPADLAKALDSARRLGDPIDLHDLAVAMINLCERVARLEERVREVAPPPPPAPWYGAIDDE